MARWKVQEYTPNGISNTGGNRTGGSISKGLTELLGGAVHQKNPYLPVIALSAYLPTGNENEIKKHSN